MNWQHAPLYTKSLDLTKWLLAAVEKLPRRRDRSFGERITGHTLLLLEEVALALTFADRRVEHLDRLDETAVRLRMTLRLAGLREVLSFRQVEFCMGQLDEIGRMVGGWKRELRRSKRAGEVT